MSNHKRNSRKANSSRILLLPLLAILLIATFVTVRQSEQPQESRSLASTPKDCTVTPGQLSIKPEEQTLVDQINAFRTLQNIPVLSHSLELKQAAAWQSNDMLKRHLLSHIDSLGRDTATRLGDCGLPFPSVVGEIIDSGTQDPADVIAAWKHSPSHTSRLLNKNFTEIGVSLATDTTGAYWAVTFAGPNIVPTLSIMPTNIITPVVPTLSPKPSTTPTPTKKPTQKPTQKPTLTPTPTKIFPRLTAKPTLIPIPNGATPTSKPIGIPVTLPQNQSPAQPTPLPSIDPKFVLNPDDTQIYVQVKINGIGLDGNKSPKHRTRRIQATIYDQDNEEVKVGSADLIFNGDLFQGNMHMGKIDNGIYSVKINSERMLIRVVEPAFQEISNQKLNVLPPVLLRQGDVTEDNSLSLNDYNLVLKCFQDKQCLRDGAEYVDFNDDTKTDVIDYNILLQSFFQLRGH